MSHHSGQLAFTVGQVCNSSFDHQGLPFPCCGLSVREWLQECEMCRVPHPRRLYRWTVHIGFNEFGSSVWWMTVHIRFNEFGRLLFTGNQELFNSCSRQQLIKSPGSADCGSMSGLCHLTNYIRIGKLASMKNRYTQTRDLSFLEVSAWRELWIGNRPATLGIWRKMAGGGNPQFINYWSEATLPGGGWRGLGMGKRDALHNFWVLT